MNDFYKPGYREQPHDKPLPPGWWRAAKEDKEKFMSENVPAPYKADNHAAVIQYLDSMGNKLTNTHRQQFIGICQAFNLNPFIREIYGIPYGDKFNIIVGYEVYLKRAETSGKLAGWKAWTEGEGKAMKRCIEILRTDWKQPFYHEVLLSEYDQNNQMWKSKPATMIKKVAIAQAFRLCFPVELGGIPYTSDEIPVPDTAPVLPAPKVRKQNRAEAEVVQESAPLVEAVIENIPEPSPIPEPPTITRIQAKDLCDMVRDNDIPLPELLAYLGTETLSTVYVHDLPRVHYWIEQNSRFPDPPAK
jgi:phage recombination protein Bet